MDAKETIREAVELVRRSDLDSDDKYFMEMALEFHGHVCPAMPAAFRAGRVALRKLGVERERNSVSKVYVEVGHYHAAGCFADGLQCATGCTFGKDNIYKLGYGKWAFTLVARDRRAVRVSIKAKVMEANFSSPFIEARKKGILPSEVTAEIALETFKQTLQRKESDFFDVSGVFTYQQQRQQIKTCFAAIKCEGCGELVAENYIRYKQGKLLCIPCSGYEQ